MEFLGAVIVVLSLLSPALYGLYLVWEEEAERKYNSARYVYVRPQVADPRPVRKALAVGGRTAGIRWVLPLA